MIYSLKIFSFKGRIERAEYVISLIITLFFINIFGELVESNNYKWVVIGYIPCYWILFAQGTKRCHDLGKNGWHQIIPFYVLFLLFKNGDTGLNRYGSI